MENSFISDFYDDKRLLSENIIHNTKELKDEIVKSLETDKSLDNIVAKYADKFNLKVPYEGMEQETIKKKIINLLSELIVSEEVGVIDTVSESKLNEYSDDMTDEEWKNTMSRMAKIADKLSRKMFKKPFKSLSKEERMEVEFKIGLGN